MGSFIPDTLVEEIRNRADIVEIIGSIIPLKKTGANYKGVCPFHQEKTPSFIVSPVKQIFHCFGCGEGGNVYHFLMRKKGLSFSEAVHIIADRYSIVIPHTGSAGKKFLDRKEIYTLNERFAHYFHNILMKGASGKSARAYLEKRGISDTAAAEFKLGYVPDRDPDGARQSVTADIKKEVVEKAGLYNFYSNGVSNRFSGRLIFPIQDYQGRIIGFGGRALSEQQQPKYLNSPETAVYHKSNTLYNFHRAKESVKETGYSIIVEGYLDLITAYMAGFKTTVAPLGTALTVNQSNLLKRLVDRAVLAFDADSAGLKAALRGVEVLMEGGMSSSVVILAEGEDPDSLIREQGAKAFQNHLDNALDEIDFLCHVSERKHDLSKAEGRIKAVSELLPLISKENNALRREEYLRRLSYAFKLDEAALRIELKKTNIGRVKPGSLQADNISVPQKTENFPEERDLVQLLLLFNGEMRQVFSESNILASFENSEWAELAEIILTQPEKILEIPGELLGQIEVKDLREKAASLLLVENKEALWENPLEAFGDLIEAKKKRINLHKIKKLHHDLAANKSENENKSPIQEIDRLKKENTLLKGAQ